MACLLSRLISYQAYLQDIGKYISQRTRLPLNMQDLKNAFTEKWDNIPQGLFNSLVDVLNYKCKVSSSV